MVLESLSKGLRGALDKVRSSLFVDDALVNDIVKELQKALLSSDVNVSLVLELTRNIKERIGKEKTPPGLSKKEHLIKIVYDELVSFVGSSQKTLDLSAKPSFIMLVGLFGSGKTTTAAKIARYYKHRGLSVACVQTDTWRPAAYDQLQQLCKSLDIPFYGMKNNNDPVAIFEHYQKEYLRHDIVIVDTAGRDALSNDLITEIMNMKKTVNPHESLLVMSADLGQAAKTQAQAFHDAVNVTGVIITKMDGTAKGGGALSACAITNAPVVFIGTGEKPGDIEPFNPEGFIGRLLGLGDLDLLLEKAKDAFVGQDNEDIQRKFLEGDYTLVDLYEQMQAMRKMGPLSKVMEMIPGMSGLKLPKEALDVQEDNLVKWKYILDSMTREELQDPSIVTSGRVERISVGSGTDYKDVKALLKQYRESKKMVKMMKGQNPKKMQKMMQRMGVPK
ncbi:MAG: signal recognition particle protein Srp54 [Candidatus Woesearchaeota archaeon]